MLGVKVRIAGGRRAWPVIAGIVLGLAAGAESITRAAVLDVDAFIGLVFCLLAVATTVPLALLRPVGAAIAVTAASVVSLVFFHTLTGAGAVAQVVALFRLGYERSQVAFVALALPFPVLALFGAGGGEARVLTVLLASLAPAAACCGMALRARGEVAEHSSARQAIAGTLLEHTARGERARISRELHDVVAHHISMIAVQAETARLTTPGMPAAGAQRLSAIGDTARAALTEMRRLLGVLRTDADSGPAELHPQPGLRQLNELLDAARDASGAGARLILRGAPVALDPGVELAAYRIIQEALTNSRRHAPGAAVDVELHYGDDALVVRIRDNGPGPSVHLRPGGHGLLGMRERAAAVGGSLQTGEAAGGGFLVTASLPGKSGVVG
jgi:signal transduction histidine kinase